METGNVINAFNLCWNFIFTEPTACNGSFFNEKHCKIQDSRDVNFNEVENRLAYVYKYGRFNVLLSSKCFSNFFNEYSGQESNFEDLKVCSLSNGPGLDIVGFLDALHRSNKNLKSYPLVKAINLYESWSTMFEILVCKASEAFSLISCTENLHFPPANVNLIQGDVFSTLSTDVENYIRDSNMLLMFKVYNSTKAKADVFASSLKQIFSLLQAGSLIFFVGSKNNMKVYSKDPHLSAYVKCIYGPQKVSLSEIPIDESIVSAIGIKPLNSGYGEFVVWQKRDESDYILNMQQKKKRTRRKKKKNGTSKNIEVEVQSIDSNSVTGDCKDDTDAESEISCSTDSKQSVLSDDLKSDSSIFNTASPDEILLDISDTRQNISQNNIACSVDNMTDAFDKIQITVSREQSLEDLQATALQSISDNLSKLVSDNQLKFKTCDVKNSNAHAAPGDAPCETVDFPQLLLKKKQEKEVTSNLTSSASSFSNNLAHSTTYPPVTDSKRNKEDNNDKSKKSQKIQFVCNIDEQPSELPTQSVNDENQSKTLFQNFPILPKMQHSNKNSLQSVSSNISKLVSDNQLKFKTCDLKNSNAHAAPRDAPCETVDFPQLLMKNKQDKEVTLNLTSSASSCSNNSARSSTHPPVTDSKHNKQDNDNKSKKSNKIQFVCNIDDQPSELPTQSVNDEKQSKTLFQHFQILPKMQHSNKNSVKFKRSVIAPSEEKQSKTLFQHFPILPKTQHFNENSVKFKSSMMAPSETSKGFNSGNESNIHTLLEKCESLIASVEKLTADIKNDVKSFKSNQCQKKNCCCVGHVCQPYICSVNSVHSNCYHKACHSDMMHICCKSRVCGNRCQAKLIADSSANFLRPYITIPLQNEELKQILSSRNFS